MVEKAIDDIAWSHNVEYTVFEDKKYNRFTCKEIDVYSERKIVEYDELIRKLKRIQDFIQDKDMKMSLKPLIDHHNRLRHAYWDVTMANSFRRMACQNVLK